MWTIVEVWRPVRKDGEEYPYEVSNRGRIRWSKSKRIMAPSVNQHGYIQTILHKNGQRTNVLLHRLVLEAFIGPCPEKYQANHINGVKTDNRPENLQWVTGRANSLHAIRSGLQPHRRGSGNGQSILTEEDIPVIRKRLSRGETQQTIGDDYGVSRFTISGIAQGRNWGWL